jgi:hypothetical protein
LLTVLVEVEVLLYSGAILLIVNLLIILITISLLNFLILLLVYGGSLATTGTPMGNVGELREIFSVSCLVNMQALGVFFVTSTTLWTLVRREGEPLGLSGLLMVFVRLFWMQVCQTCRLKVIPLPGSKVLVHLESWKKG